MNIQPSTSRQRTALLDVRHISHAYGETKVIEDLSFQLEQGEIGCLLGASGCGKTTALRAIAGFEPVTGGEIRLSGLSVSRPSGRVPPEVRGIGMVFQDYALFPHLTVADNVAFGLRSLSRKERARRAAEMLEVVGLAHTGTSYPHELSGGQQQRVALARALAPEPRLLLMDEPFSNLDVELRARLSLEVRDILKRRHATALIVTHDQHEAFAMADRIGVMHRGRLEQWDTPYNLYHRPATRHVADFVGQGVLLKGRVINAREVEIELGVLRGEIPVPCAASGSCEQCGRDCRVDVLIRPDDIIHDDDSPVLAEVVRKAFRGADFLYTLKLPGGTQVLAQVDSHHNHAIGEKIGIKLGIDHVVTFSPDPSTPGGS